MGIDAEGVLLEATAPAAVPPVTWRVCGWPADLPRGPAAQAEDAGKYALLFHMVRMIEGEEEMWPLPLMSLCEMVPRGRSRHFESLCPTGHQRLSAIPGRLADLHLDASTLAEVKDHFSHSFYAFGLKSFAERLLDGFETQLLVPEDRFWRDPELDYDWDYGSLFVHALRLAAYGSWTQDMSCHFESLQTGHASQVQIEAKESSGFLVGQIELHFDAWTDGQVQIEDQRATDSMTFAGKKVVIDLGCRKLKNVSLECSTELSTWRLLGPPAACGDQDLLPLMDAWRRWFQLVLMSLRRHLPQGPTRRVLQLCRPAFPQRLVAIGLTYDHLDCNEWSYHNPCLDGLVCSEEELIELVKGLQCYGCPFQLPFWLQI